MTLSTAQHDSIENELKRIQENALYSAQAYFEAAKRAEFWARLIVFIPACVAALAGLMASIDSWKFWGAAAAVSGAVAATGSFLGSTNRATDYLNSARSYTVLRHKIHLELNLLSSDLNFPDIRARTAELNSEYTQIVSTDFPLSNRAFNIARRRISEGAAS